MSQRSDQVAEELRKIVSMIVLEELDEPGKGFITITRIEMKEDLRYAKVFYSVLGDEAQKQITSEILERNMGFIKHLAIERLNMRYAMDIKFELDESIEHSFEIDSILKKIKKDGDKA